MEIYITCLLQILSFSSSFRGFDMKTFSSLDNHGGRQYFVIDSPPPLPEFFFIFAGLYSIDIAR